MRTPHAVLLAAAILAVAIALPLPAAAQGMSPNSPFTWVHGPRCSSPAWGFVGCCCRRPVTVKVTKYATRTAFKTVKRTKTAVRTVTATSLVRRRLEEREEPVEPQVAAQEVLEVDNEDVLPPTPVNDEAVPVVGSGAPAEPANGAADNQSPLDADDDDEHRLFARDYCPACSAGMVPRPSASGRTARCCVTKLTQFTTRTRTTTKVKTKTVKTATKTVTTTVAQTAAVRIPVSVTSDGKPVANALVELLGTAQTSRRLVVRQEDVLGFCVTEPDGSCIVLLPKPLLPLSSFFFRSHVGVKFIKIISFADNFGQPPPPPPGGFVLNLDNPTTVRVGRRELIARRQADGVFRRAIKARATPEPAPRAL
ncbi:hypothetical protein DFJ74DRAFT_713036 [Hyaloraphidium curvatum]|nr:hypothetical protein DFJ74DRAFT_713036 [Hyaloraphidium curvatum]